MHNKIVTGQHITFLKLININYHKNFKLHKKIITEKQIYLFPIASIVLTKLPQIAPEKDMAIPNRIYLLFDSINPHKAKRPRITKKCINHLELKNLLIRFIIHPFHIQIFYKFTAQRLIEK